MRDKTIVGHSLQDDLEILKLDVERDNIEIRDISNIEIFMEKIDKHSKSPIRASED